MSAAAVAVASIGLPWPCKLPQHATHSQKSNHFTYPTRGNPTRQHNFRPRCYSQVPISPSYPQIPTLSANSFHGSFDISNSAAMVERLVFIDLDPATAKLAIGFLGPFLSAFGFLFVVRIVMSWYPKLPVGKFPYVIAYAPTEPLLAQTRKLIPPLGGVDVTPVVWFGLISFINEILVGPQGLLVLVSQQQV